MINSFTQYLVEEESMIYFTFGRMNPPTVGHEKLLDKLAKFAGKSPYRVYLSQSSDPKKNPLPYKNKVSFARKMFPRHARSILLNNKVKSVFDVAVTLYNEGYRNVTMVVGSDRVNEFDILLNKYNGKKARHGFYNFENIKVMSAGERDPDSEGVDGMSASKMRAAAAANEFSTFSQGLPKKFSNADSKALYNEVRSGMGLKEESVFKNHIELPTVSEEREAFVAGELFKEGQEVIIKKTDEVGIITMLGANYLIIETADRKTRQWLDAVEVIEGREDPDIKDRKGSQPANYHKGLKKSTKISRDAHFKKNAKKDDNDPSAYKKAPGDAKAKTKPSKYTLKFKQMFGDD